MLEKNAEKLIVGAALAFAAATIWPIVKNTLKPLAESGKFGAAGLTNRVQFAFGVAREEIEDIVAEAQFERMRKRLDRDIAENSASFEETEVMPHAESND